MKILYIANIRLPTEKAHGVQIMKTCEAFAVQGVNISLLIPNYFLSLINTDLFFYYGIKKPFSIRRILSIRLIYFGRIGFFLETFLFFIGLVFKRNFWTSDYVFTRDGMLAWLSNLCGRKVIWETHTGGHNYFARKTLKNSALVVTISQGLKDFYVSKGADSSKMVVSPDGVDLKDFDIPESKTEARIILGLPLDKKIILYAGRLDGWKGVETFLEASTGFNEDTVAVIVGGDKNQVDEFKKKYIKVLFVGFQSYKELPKYQRSADVLVIPNTAKDIISKLYTSPLKVFTYMASRVPIVASDLPSIREVLDSSCAVLVQPDNPKAFFDGIHSILEGRVDDDRITEEAFKKVSNYTWNSRVGKILDSIEYLK